jgi:hypothetical protein
MISHDGLSISTDALSSNEENQASKLAFWKAVA